MRVSIETDIANLSRKFAANPASRIFAPLAEAYRKAGRLTEAVDVCLRGLQHHPDYLGGRLVLARSYYEMGDLELAAGAFRDVLVRDPGNVVALRSLGEVAAARGETGQAASWYARALDSEPENPELLERLETLRSRPAPALPISSAEARGVPHEAAHEAASRRREVEASPATTYDMPIAAAGAREPESAFGMEIATATLAEVYSSQGLHERALEVYRKLLVTHPDDSVIRQKVEELEGRTRDVAVQAAADGTDGRTADGAPGLGAGTREPFTESGGEDVRDPSWAFLLEEEEDEDPDLVFAAVGGRSRSEEAGPARASSEHEPIPAPGGESAQAPGARDEVAEEFRPGEQPTAEEAALKEFREWLRNLR
jgi:tetratricopeptide (TPR) repeat protein